MTESEYLIEKSFEQLHYNPEKSLEIFNRILKVEPYNINAINGKASALMKLKQVNEAEKCFNKSLMLADNSYAFLNLGLIYKDRGEYEKALNYFDNAIIINVKLSDIITIFKREVFDKIELDNMDLKFENFNNGANKHILEGIKNEKEANYWDALESYENAMDKDPSSKIVMNSLIRRLDLQIHNELIYEDKTSENIQNSFLKRKIAESMLTEEKPLKATGLVDKALTENPDDVVLLNFKGGIEFCYDNYDESIQYFNKCIDLEPDYHYAIFNKSIVFRRLKRYEEALELLNDLTGKPELNHLIKYHKSGVLKKVQSSFPSR